MLPFCVITPRSIRNGTGIPSSRIYFFLRLCEREIFGCLVEAFIFFLIVMVPFLLTRYTTDGDWSQAAFFMVLGAIGGKVTVKGVAKDSTQGDKKCAEILAEFGAKVTQRDNEVTVEKGDLKAITIDASQIPDLVPVLSVCAAFAEGTTKIINAERLRIKECDRLKAIAELLNNLGGKVKELSDGLEITGVSSLKGGNVNGYNDHRIVMSAAVCAARSDEDITATFAMSINKSYPDFYIDYNSIGGKANVLDLR